MLLYSSRWLEQQDQENGLQTKFSLSQAHLRVDEVKLIRIDRHISNFQCSSPSPPTPQSWLALCRSLRRTAAVLWTMVSLMTKKGGAFGFSLSSTTYGTPPMGFCIDGAPAVVVVELP